MSRERIPIAKCARRLSGENLTKWKHGDLLTAYVDGFLHPESLAFLGTNVENSGTTEAPPLRLQLSALRAAVGFGQMHQCFALRAPWCSPRQHAVANCLISFVSLVVLEQLCWDVSFSLDIRRAGQTAKGHCTHEGGVLEG